MRRDSVERSAGSGQQRPQHFTPGIEVLLIHAAREKAAVHRQKVSRDEAGRFGREKNRGARELFRLTEAPHRGAHQ